MPLGDIVGEVAVVVVRGIVQIFVEIVVEILVKGPGYLLVKLFKANAGPDGLIVFLVGILFWMVIAICSFIIYKSYFA